MDKCRPAWIWYGINRRLYIPALKGNNEGSGGQILIY